ncbi:MAG: TlyA family RNA methyltransferase [Pseudomonadota bacterium]|nr:TlyA family RNA methyltransferase [Pseudomonadota bacterium]
MRLDDVLVARGLADTSQRARGLVAAGEVLVDEVPCDKPATTVRPEQAVRLRSAPARYVSRGGLKLEAAFDAWPVDPTARVCVDLGASTGGFTDCLLQRGAAKVYAVDVGYGQLAWTLRQDPRVVVMERTNARRIEAFPEPISLLVADLSFISLTLVLPTIRRLVAPRGEAVLLVKPQFEVAATAITKGGRVDDEDAIESALAAVAAASTRSGFTVHATLESPVPGAKAGNREWLLWLGPPSVVS